jgi:hypothetical protein
MFGIRTLVVLLLLLALTQLAPASPRIVGACQYYKWGNAIWREEYEPEGAQNMKNPNTGVPLTGPGGYEGLTGVPYNPTPMRADWKSVWKVSHWNAIMWKYGMLSIKGRADGGEVTLTRKGGAKYGRWESKMMIVTRKSKTNAWRALLELVPVKSSANHCGAQTITYGDFTKGSYTGSMQINTLPARSYQHSVSLPRGATDPYHTFGVEVAKDHIAWFVDDRVAMYEKRKAALPHPKLTLRIRFLNTGGPVNADETPDLQFDWNRFWSLKRPNQRPIKQAPKCSRVITNTAAC